MRNDMNDADTYRVKHTTAFGSGQLRTVCRSAPYFVQELVISGQDLEVGRVWIFLKKVLTDNLWEMGKTQQIWGIYRLRYMYCTNLTTQYAMTKYLGKEISNLVLLSYDKASYTSALLSIYFFKACV